ncbi:MAG: hypothetical protein BGO88_09900 [Flavobacterium sp. 38-13]|uniref:hypothetical protein n=1 Tax=Flavobacterium sp. 38-13 TaxID=1896168 RepID=UPI00095EC8A0|nr:hypothetical protein [Flavobacterium sp. 38-13]OJX53977.1 MAG: hypothetical protein BGO88_09900 [Flavobacterium sp. 38-13]
MALIFKKGWNEARKDYVKKYGKYQAFLDTLTESLIVGAFRNARNHFSDHWVLEFIDIATNPGRVEQVSIEQGSHQPEDLTGGGFCLHFTGRDNSGYAFHFYIIQNLDGTPRIIEISYRENGQTVNDYRR